MQCGSDAASGRPTRSARPVADAPNRTRRMVRPSLRYPSLWHDAVGTTWYKSMQRGGNYRIELITVHFTMLPRATFSRYSPHAGHLMADDVHVQLPLRLVDRERADQRGKGTSHYSYHPTHRKKHSTRPSKKMSTTRIHRTTSTRGTCAQRTFGRNHPFGSMYGT